MGRDPRRLVHHDYVPVLVDDLEAADQPGPRRNLGGAGFGDQLQHRPRGDYPGGPLHGFTVQQHPPGRDQLGHPGTAVARHPGGDYIDSLARQGVRHQENAHARSDPFPSLEGFLRLSSTTRTAALVMQMSATLKMAK